MEFLDLLSHHAAHAVEKQMRLAGSVAGTAWSWDLGQSLLRIGGENQSFQLLGIEREADRRWRWAWADAATEEEEGLPEGLIQASRALREVGVRQQIPELVEPEVDLAEFSGQAVAALATGLFEARGWWRAPFQGGVAWLLLPGSAPAANEPPAPVEMASVLTRTLALLPVDHQIAMDAYVVHHGGSVERDGATATARMRSGSMIARFDGGKKIERLETKVA